MSDKSRRNKHEHHERYILEQLELSGTVTQRGLAADMGIALGLTNLLMRRLVRRGWVRVRRLSPGRVRYVITPAGVAAQARLRREYFLSNLRVYGESRQRMQERLAALARELGTEPDASEAIVFYGAGDAAELAYVCLQDTGLRLAGVVDSMSLKSFFGAPVYEPVALEGCTLSGRPFGRLVVMPLQDEGIVREQLEARRVPEGRVFWI